MFIESFIELSEPICIPSSETFAVILYRLLLIRLQNFHKLGEGGSPDHGPLPVTTEVLTFMASWILCERGGFRVNFQEIVRGEQQIIN